jgi:hypothetical protein
MNIETGRLKKNILDERVLSCIIEFKTKIESVTNVLEILRHIEPELNTVFSLGLISRFDEEGELPIINVLKSGNINTRINSKVNVGLGRPLSEA